MTILRDTLYSDKVLAVLREYSSNAWDAHRMVGKGDMPITIRLPTLDDPALIIRDYGPGMSQDEVFNIYTQYGESTKRNTDEAVGMMGIGSKSAFAYSDSFTVTSWNGGWQRIYVAVLDESNIGEIQCLDECECDLDDTGIEIQVPVKSADIYEFTKKAINLFKYFDPQPAINCHLPTIDKDRLPSGFVSSGMQEWVATMGCIPYRLNLEQLRPALEEAGLWNPLQKINGGLCFAIGEVNVAASREELKYTEFTKKAIVAKFTAMIDEHIVKALEDISDSNLSDWETRKKSVFMTHVVGFKLPKAYAEWSKAHVDLWGYQYEAVQPDGSSKTERRESPRSFQLYKGGVENDKSTNSLVVTQGDGARFVVVDDPRDIKGFSFKQLDYVVKRTAYYTIDDVVAELNDYVVKAKLTGVPIIRLSASAIGWYKPWESDPPKPRVKSVKHRTKAFKLIDKPHATYSQHSKNWEPHSWVSADSDVYVVLESFKPKSFGSAAAFCDTLIKDQQLAVLVGVDFPHIYGYKDTESKPFNPTKVKGLGYTVWASKVFMEAIKDNQETQKLIEWLSWIPGFVSEEGGRGLSYGYVIKMSDISAKMAKRLGHLHPMVVATNKMALAGKSWEDTKYTYDVLRRLLSIAGSESKIEKALDDMKSKYPLMFMFSNYQGWGDAITQWVDYIMMCDRAMLYESQVNSLVNDILSEGLPVKKAA